MSDGTARWQWGLLASCLLIAASCYAPRPDWNGGSQSGDLEILGESCDCVFYPDDDEVYVSCGYFAESDRRVLVAWLSTSPRYYERSIGSAWMWVSEPGEICDYYGSGVAETWVGPPEPDRSGTTSTMYAPVHIRRWVVPQQEMCQGNGITCFDYENCIDWQESTGDEVHSWCRVSYF